jgi:hypothetical protein
MQLARWGCLGSVRETLQPGVSSLDGERRGMLASVIADSRISVLSTIAANGISGQGKALADDTNIWLTISIVECKRMQ